MSANDKPSRSIRRLVLDLLVLGLTGVAAWFMWPSVLGGSSQAVVVHGHSMEPTYSSGDLVVLDTDAVTQVGGIIVLKIPHDEPGAGLLVVHRITGVRDDGTYITQGDNSANPDVFLTNRSDILGSPRFSIPHGGQALAIIGSPIGLAAATGGLCTVLLWPRKRDTETSTLEAALIEEQVDETDVAAEAEVWLREQLAAQGWLSEQLAPVAPCSAPPGFRTQNLRIKSPLLCR